MAIEKTSVPVPDPTILTTQQLFREVTMLKELLGVQFSGYDKAIALLQSRADRSPTIDVVQQQLEKECALTAERFRGVQMQFGERDTRMEQNSRDSKVAVDAALQAAKEAVGEQNKSSALSIAKSEAGTTKQIDQILLLIQSSNKALDDKIIDLKDRIVMNAGEKKGTESGWAWAVGVIGLILTIGSIVVIVVKL